MTPNRRILGILAMSALLSVGIIWIFGDRLFSPVTTPETDSSAEAPMIPGGVRVTAPGPSLPARDRAFIRLEVGR